MQLVDQLSSLSLSKSVAPQRGQIAAHLCSGDEQQTEFTLTSLHFLSATLQQDPEPAVSKMLSYYPSIIFRQLLASERPLVVAATAAFLAALADGDAGAQRYCRLEEVLTKLVAVLCRHAAALQHADAADVQVRTMLEPLSSCTVHWRCAALGLGCLEPRSLPGMQGHCDVLANSGKALCALTAGCPDNDMHIANHDGTTQLAQAVGTLAAPPAKERSVQVQQQVDEAAGTLAALLCTLSRCAMSLSRSARVCGCGPAAGTAGSVQEYHQPQNAGIGAESGLHGGCL